MSDLSELHDQLLNVPEDVCVRYLLEEAAFSDAFLDRVHQAAVELITGIQAKPPASAVDEILQSFPLASEEGRALLCFAEAFLRTPDNASRLLLARDKLAGRRWEAKLPSTLRARAAIGLLAIASRICSARTPSLTVNRAGDRIVALLVSLVGRAVMHQLGHHYVLGQTIEEALSRISSDSLTRYSFDMLGESAITDEDALKYFEAYKRAIDLVGRTSAAAPVLSMPSVSVKLSALHPRYEYAQRHGIEVELGGRLLELVERAAAHNVGLTLDAEESDRLIPSIVLFARVARTPSIQKWEGFGLAVQAYQRGALSTLERLQRLSGDLQRRIPVRLVKGAYWDWEIKRAQDMGLLQFPVFTRKATADVSYLACARFLARHPKRLYPQFATHNAHTAAAVLNLMDGQQFELQRLHGMGEALYQELQSRHPVPVRVYAPIGGHKELLPYLVRRLLENGASSSFVQRLASRSFSPSELARNPIEVLSAETSTAHPNIHLPRNLFGPGRMNSRGYDLTSPSTRAMVAARMRAYVERPFEAGPIVGGEVVKGEPVAIRDPSDQERTVGYVVHADRKEVDFAITLADGAFPAWDALGGDERGKILERAADLMEERMPELMGLIAREGGRTVVPSMNEVREAVDFLRYYALLARKDFSRPEELPGPAGEKNLLYLCGRGNFACIAPWNFPLAIFVGQIAAALAAGNCVLAKPAEQTPLIGAVAVRLLHEAGVPPNVLHYLPGLGEVVGDALVRDARIAGVAFTGSTETAKLIHGTLASKPGPIVPLIAETGGQNTMIVDSTANIEQTVKDALVSAFDSVGQRCSALRVLYVQDDIADKLIDALKGAMALLKLGDPIEFDTDIGPMIDEAARAALTPHLEHMDRDAKLIYRHPGIKGRRGFFLGPVAYEIPSIKMLKNEVFGPVLHIVRWKRSDLDNILLEIKSTGFALTMGIQTCVDSTRDYIFRKSRCGNVYVNRTIIGAVVGVQPFGGEGLSGTGPKAGGPRYLYRYATERTLTINTATAGGSAALTLAA